MKNVFTTLVTVAALATGSAALADNGFVDNTGHINAQHPNITAHQTGINDNATRGTAEMTNHGETKQVDATIFASDESEKKDDTRIR